MQYHHAEDETAGRYVARTLDVPETDAFEQHLLLCESCRSEVRLASAIRSEIREQPRGINPWVVGTGLALAASIAIFLARPDNDSLSALGRVASAPVYDGVPVRATTNATDSLFGSAMGFYQQGEYGEASRRFEAARAAGADSIVTTFFMGVSNLMTGNAAAAVNELQRSAGMSRSAYSQESHFYLAKAYLQLGRREAALGELAMAIGIEGPVATPAKLLADSIKVAR